MLLQMIHHPLNANQVFFKPLTAADNGVFKDMKIAVPLRYLSNFWRSLEMPLINCKIHLKLNWTKNCVMSTIADTTFKITNTKLYIPIVILSSKDNVKLVKLLEEGFKRSVYCNEYQAKVEARNSTVAQDFLLMLLFKELEDCLLLLLIILLLIFLMIQLTILTIELKETATENIFFQK